MWVGTSSGVCPAGTSAGRSIAGSAARSGVHHPSEPGAAERLTASVSCSQSCAAKTTLSGCRSCSTYRYLALFGLCHVAPSMRGYRRSTQLERQRRRRKRASRCSDSTRDQSRTILQRQARLSRRRMGSNESTEKHSSRSWSEVCNRICLLGIFCLAKAQRSRRGPEWRMPSPNPRVFHKPSRKFSVLADPRPGCISPSTAASTEAL